MTDLVQESSLSAVCPVCNSQSPSSLDFLHFQHLCCVHHMEAPAGMICSSPQSFASSFSLPCCRQRIHYECLARSVHSCGDHCPFCTQDLVPVLTLFWQPSNTSTFPSTSTRPLPIPHSTLSLCVPDDMPHPPPISPICCADICGPPDWMEWSPTHPYAQGSSSVLHAVRPRPCRTSLLFPQSRVLSVPPLLQSCLTDPLDALCCVSCQLVVPHDSVASPFQPSCFHRRLLSCRLTGFRTVLCPGFHHS